MKRRSISARQHSAVSQKTVMFIQSLSSSVLIFCCSFFPSAKGHNTDTENLHVVLALLRPYVHTHFAVGCVLAVALKSCVLMQQGKWLLPPSPLAPLVLLRSSASSVAGGILPPSAEDSLSLMPCQHLFTF
jgi:hypothetical protein